MISSSWAIVTLSRRKFGPRLYVCKSAQDTNVESNTQCDLHLSQSLVYVSYFDCLEIFRFLSNITIYAISKTLSATYVLPFHWKSLTKYSHNTWKTFWQSLGNFRPCTFLQSASCSLSECLRSCTSCKKLKHEIKTVLLFLSSCTTPFLSFLTKSCVHNDLCVWE